MHPFRGWRVERRGGACERGGALDTHQLVKPRPIAVLVADLQRSTTGAPQKESSTYSGHSTGHPDQSLPIMTSHDHSALAHLVRIRTVAVMGAPCPCEPQHGSSDSLDGNLQPARGLHLAINQREGKDTRQAPNMVRMLQYSWWHAYVEALVPRKRIVEGLDANICNIRTADSLQAHRPTSQHRDAAGPPSSPEHARHKYCNIQCTNTVTYSSPVQASPVNPPGSSTA